MLLKTFAWLLVAVCVQVLFEVAESTYSRTFTIDWANDRFLKNGQPFRFMAGSLNYFRTHPFTWERKLKLMRNCGLNTVTTYVDWSLHNPKDGSYFWNGAGDLERFIQTAVAEDLFVILRPGPYICAERDFGGLPYWLLTKYPSIRPRTADPNYLHEVRIWYEKLMTKMIPYFYGNGGPIIMVQVENEYGSFFACDNNYRTWLRDETLKYVKDKAVLFTNDGPNALNCGHIDGVLATLDFGPTNNVTAYWNNLRRIQPKGPLVNTEYYTGWLTHWGENVAEVPINLLKQTLIEMLDHGANVNFYMFYGGTNFGFSAGANDAHYQPDITSYDYDAPLNEAGDPTPKYFAIREIISRYLPLPNTPVPEPLPKKKYGTFKLQECCGFLSSEARNILASGTVTANKPKTFEALDQYSGIVLYETFLPATRHDPAILQVPGLRDRAYVYVDNEFMGILSRETPIYTLPISLSAGKKLQMFVENQGRINYGPIIDFKGITSDVIFDNKVLENWNMTTYPLQWYPAIENVIKQAGVKYNVINSAKMLQNGPTIFHGCFQIKDEKTYDTYVDTTGWGKGLLFINAEPLGRYWPAVGPQITLYVPADVLKVGKNVIVLIEYQSASPSREITFTDYPNFSKTTFSKKF